jgi:hypothetical protein
MGLRSSVDSRYEIPAGAKEDPDSCRIVNSLRYIGRLSCLVFAFAFLVGVNARGASVVAPNKDAVARPPAPSELIYEGTISYGNFRLFGAAENVKLYTAGIEYDREVWPRFIHARVDYVSELLPVVLLSQPARTDFWGDTMSRNRKIIPGLGITPLGARLLWRDGKRWMPYFETKATVLGFTQKALSSEATYENWSFHITGGLKLKLHGPYDLRLGMLSDLHFSNAFVVRSNPAVDLMNVNVGIVYHLRPQTNR